MPSFDHIRSNRLVLRLISLFYQAVKRTPAAGTGRNSVANGEPMWWRYRWPYQDSQNDEV